MADGIKEIIAGLERQKSAIERALSALRDVDGSVIEATPVAARTRTAKKAVTKAVAKATRKGGMTEEGRKRLSEALRQRWAAKRAASAEAEAPVKRGRRKKA